MYADIRKVVPLIEHGVRTLYVEITILAIYQHRQNALTWSSLPATSNMIMKAENMAFSSTAKPCSG